MLTLSVSFLVALLPSEHPLAWHEGESSLGPVSRRPSTLSDRASSSRRALVPATKRDPVAGERTNLDMGVGGDGEKDGDGRCFWAAEAEPASVSIAARAKSGGPGGRGGLSVEGGLIL